MSQNILRDLKKNSTQFSSQESTLELEEAVTAWANRLESPGSTHLHELEQLAQVKLP